MVLASTLPESVPAVTIDRQCGSSQQSLHFAAQAVMSGTQDIVIASGVESMTRVPMGSPFMLAAKAGVGSGPFPSSIQQKYSVPMFSQLTGAEMICEQYQMTREELDAFALDSHRKAAAATDAGAFADEILPLDGVDRQGIAIRHAIDEGIRRDASMEGLAALEPISPGGRIT